MNTIIKQSNNKQAAVYTHADTESLFYDGMVWNTGSYSRLSREDGDKEESDSIGNQKDLIKSFIQGKPDIKLINEYEDDGWSGVNFERPSFKKLLEDIRGGLINCVIVKDLSRLGRNYIETGKLLERFFPFMGVRFIAINDNYDSQNHNAQTDNLIIPFKNLINDAYCADTSRKIRSLFEMKRQKGDYIGSFAVFGYLKDPCNKNHLIIDENVAPVVQNIFRWKIEGLNQQGIANRLNEMGILSPLEYKEAIGSKFSTKFKTNNRAKWTHVSVLRILQNEIYTGVLLQGKTTTPNYKVKQRVKRSEEEWVRIEQSHEPIIPAEDFTLAASLLKADTRTAPDKSTVYLFSGMLFCGDCGQNLVRKNVPSKNGKFIYHICSTYKKGGGCESHSINDNALYEAVFVSLKQHIERCVTINEMLSFIQNMPFRQLDIQNLLKQIEYRKVEIEKINKRKIKLYEDLCDNIITKEDYLTYKNVFNIQAETEEKALAKLEQEIACAVNNQGGQSRWIEHFIKYQNIESLTRTTVVELIERITVFDNKKIQVHIRYQSEFDDAILYIESTSINGHTIGQEVG